MEQGAVRDIGKSLRVRPLGLGIQDGEYGRDVATCKGLVDGADYRTVFLGGELAHDNLASLYAAYGSEYTRTDHIG